MCVCMSILFSMHKVLIIQAERNIINRIIMLFQDTHTHLHIQRRSVEAGAPKPKGDTNIFSFFPPFLENIVDTNYIPILYISISVNVFGSSANT